MKNIYIVAGHTDKKDPGAVANGTTEHAEVKEVAISVVDTLKKLSDFKDYKVYLVPTNLTLREKITYLNKKYKKNDLILSLHMNSAGSAKATGIETLYLGGNTTQKKNAAKLQKGLYKTMKLRSRGEKPDTSTRHGRLGIIRDTIAEAYLFEMGFVTNVHDIAAIRKYGVDAVVAALKEYFGMKSNLAIEDFMKKKDPVYQLKRLETELDDILREGRLMTNMEEDMEKKREKWDLKLDRVRGKIIQEVKENKDVLNSILVEHEVKTMRKYALENNDLIEQLVEEIRKRKAWEGKVQDLRAIVRRLLV